MASSSSSSSSTDRAPSTLNYGTLAEGELHLSKPADSQLVLVRYRDESPTSSDNDNEDDGSSLPLLGKPSRHSSSSSAPPASSSSPYSSRRKSRKVEDASKNTKDKDNDEDEEGDKFIWEGFALDSRWRHVLFWCLCLCTCGLFWIFVFWLPHWKVRLVGRRVPLQASDTLIVRRSAYRTTLSSCLMQGGLINPDISVCRVHRPHCDPALLQGVLPGASDFLVDDGIRSVHLLATDFQFHTHLFSKARAAFVPVDPASAFTCSSKDTTSTPPEPLLEEQRRALVAVFGGNRIATPLTAIGTLLLREILHPFYLFQVFAIVLWILIDYWSYSIAIFVGVLLSTTSTVWQLHKNELRLRRMAHFQNTVQCFTRRPRTSGSSGTSHDNHGDYEVHQHELSSEDLVPGDVIAIRDELVLPCDVQLIGEEATNVLVNEALLTGESIPISKTSYRHAARPIDSLLYGGTSIVQARPQGTVLGRVLSTGFCTAKGALIRSVVVSPMSESATEFTRQGFLVLGVMFVLAILGVVVNSFSIPRALFNYSTFRQALLILDITTIAVPPALPMALSIGVTFALRRLRKNRVVCTAPSAVNVCGQIELVCFDKTGTLTTDDLLLHSLVDPTGQAVPAKDIVRDVTPSSNFAHFLVASSCHALTKLDSGELVGDPLDQRLYESLASVLNMNTKQHQQHSSTDQQQANLIIEGVGSQHAVHIEVLKRYPFESSAQRMTVIVRVNHEHDFVLMKGSPEVVVGRFCRAHDQQHGGIPWTEYTCSGYRVLAAAIRPIDSPATTAAMLARRGGHIDKDDDDDDQDGAKGKGGGAGDDDDDQVRRLVEEEGRFDLVGALVFENPIKEASPSTIQELQRIRVRSVMITGDHPFTALYTARTCGMVTCDDDGGGDDDDDLVGGGEQQQEEDRTSSVKRVSIQENNRVKLKDKLRPYLFDPDTSMWRPVKALNSGGDVQQVSMDDMASQLLFDRSLVPVMTGSGYEWMHSPACSDHSRRVLLRTCNVWSRMKPEQKQGLVRDMQRQLGLKTAMVGDGSNDCSALKQADVGLSLSNQAEATMAAPFTSRDDSPRRILQLLREGRAALASSFSLFRYIVYYSMVQYTCTLILYWYINKFGDYHYLLQDLLCVAPLALTMAYTGPRDRLSVARPPGQILSAFPVTAMLAQSFLQAAFQIAVLILLLTQPWYSPTPNAGELGTMSYVVSALFQFTFLQTTVLGPIVSVGWPFRQEMWRNWMFMIAVVVVLTFSITLLFGPLGFKVPMEVREMPVEFEAFILVAAVIYALIALFIEVALGRGIIPPPIRIQVASKEYETL